MKTPVEVRLPGNTAWFSGLLTDERSFGHPVILLEGESHPRSPIEVYTIRPVMGTDDMLMEDEVLPGFRVLVREIFPVT